MKDIGWALLATVVIFFLSLTVVTPIISNIGYSSVEGSYHAATHALLLSLIFIVIVCTMIVLEEIKSIRSDLEKESK